MSTHLAAVSPAKGERYQVQSRTTPQPGPGELLVQVKSVAINPADAHMRNGLFISTYPTVVGFDMSGLVLEVGENVPSQGPGPSYRPGARVAVYAASFWKGFNPDYGIFQERCLVPWQHAAPLPDEGLSWNEAATLPVAAEVPQNAWDMMGIPRFEESRQSSKEKKDILLVWGASSSIGTMGVQSARMLCEDASSPFAAVYATAGAANHEYITSLGADRVFDYKDPQVVETIVSAAKEGGLAIRHCFLATGDLALCQAVLKAFVGNNEAAEKQTAKLASAPILPPDLAEIDGVEVIFVMPSIDEATSLAQFEYWLGTWLRQSIIKGTIKPSPEPKVIGKGLEAVNGALDEILRGVSCSKLVLEISQ